MTTDYTEHKFIDIGTLIELRNCISTLTKLDFSLYSQSGSLLIPPISADRIIEAFSLSESGREEHENYIKMGIAKAFLRKSPSPLKGPVNQYHYFIPVQVGSIGFSLVGKAFYTSMKDIEDFLVSKCSSYGLSKSDMMSWSEKTVQGDITKLSEVNESIHHLFSLVLKDNYEKQINKERYRIAMTIMELFSEIEEDISRDSLYSLLSDAITFLFSTDTISVMTRTHDKFVPVLTTGMIKKQVEHVSLGRDNIIISDAVGKHSPVVFAQTSELLRLGYPDDVTSMYLFPISMKEETVALLGIFNSKLSTEDVDMIFNLCNSVALLLKDIICQKMVSTYIDNLSAVNLALDMSPAFQNLDIFCESIVEVSSKLMNAEKSSIMLPEDDTTELIIKAARGMNKWIAKNIRIKAGEGIAGRVYKEGKLLIISDVELNLSIPKRPRYRTGSFVSIPLKVGDEVMGVLNIADKINGEVFSEEDMTFLHFLASHASIAIKGAHYYRESEEMRTLCFKDSTTGLFNRRYFDDRIFEEQERAKRYDSVLSLAIFDIDDFKLINDREGHLAGDKVLRAIADISRESLRSSDIIARFGGDEFAIIMPQTDKDMAFLVAERVRKNITELIPMSWKNFPHETITVSIGVTTLTDDMKDAKALIKNADLALYRAKIQGKKRTVVMET